MLILTLDLWIAIISPFIFILPILEMRSLSESTDFIILQKRFVTDKEQNKPTITQISIYNRSLSKRIAISMIEFITTKGKTVIQTDTPKPPITLNPYSIRDYRIELTGDFYRSYYLQASGIAKDLEAECKNEKKVKIRSSEIWFVGLDYDLDDKNVQEYHFRSI